MVGTMARGIFISVFALIVTSGIANAETAATGTVLTTEGVSGDVDKLNREPVLSVRAAAGATSATIYADAYVIDGDFKKYPIQFDFYVNRSLFASQVRSTELPGPVGITVEYTKVPLPFNYTVVARVLHPNRTFTTVLNAAVERIDPTPTPGGASTTFNCTLDETLDSDTVTYSASSVAITEAGTALSGTFDMSEENGSGTLTITLATTEDASNLSGALKVDDGSGTPTTANVTGTYQKSGSTLSSFTANSADGAYKLQCTAA